MSTLRVRMPTLAVILHFSLLLQSVQKHNFPLQDHLLFIAARLWAWVNSALYNIMDIFNSTSLTYHCICLQSVDLVYKASPDLGRGCGRICRSRRTTAQSTSWNFTWCKSNHQCQSAGSQRVRISPRLLGSNTGMNENESWLQSRAENSSVFSQTSFASMASVIFAETTITSRCLCAADRWIQKRLGLPECLGIAESQLQSRVQSL